MYVTRKSPRALSRIHNAIQDVFGYGWADDAGGGGGGADKGDAKGADKKDADKGEPEKLTFTKEELERKISDAKASAKREADEDRKRDEQKAAKEKAKEEGNKDALLKAAEDEKTAEKTRADVAEAKAKALELKDALRTHLDDNKPELAKAAPVIAKLIDPGEEDTDKAIKAAVAEYEKSLPEKPKGSAASPAGASRQSARGITATELPKNQNERSVRRFRTLTSR